jgi:transposase
MKLALNQGWIMSPYVTVYFDPTDGEWYAEVYLSKPANIASPKKQSIGVDVGVNKITASSEGRKGNSLIKRLKYLRKAASERQRQLALAKNKKDDNLVKHLESQLKKNKGNQKSIVKELLDKEAKLLIACCLATSSNLIIEDPKVLANLKLRSYLVRWAKNYFAKRILVLGREWSVFILPVHPAYTSISCNKCGWQARQNRIKERFYCVKCGHSDHADINAAKNLAWKGQQSVDQNIIPSLQKKGLYPVP